MLNRRRLSGSAWRVCSFTTWVWTSWIGRNSAPGVPLNADVENKPTGLRSGAVFVTAIAAWAGSAACLFSVGPAAAAKPARSSDCTVAAIQKIAPTDTTIVSADEQQTPAPYCKVMGVVQARDPDSKINFRLSLPRQWSGRYYFMGLGGAAGFMPPPPSKILMEGFAVAVTDTGHQGPILDYSFALDKVKMLDHSHRAAHLTAVASQTITKAFYGAAKMYRYMVGCSGGGRMGMMAAERHPHDFDGIVMAAPGVSQNAPLQHMWALKQIFRSPDAWVSPAKLANLETAIAKKCAGPDGLIRDVKACGFQLNSMMCRGKDGPTCLTRPEIQTLQAMVDGPPAVVPGVPRQGFAMTNPSQWSATIFGTTRPDVTNIKNPWAPNPPTWAFALTETLMNSIVIRDPSYNFMTDFDFNKPADVQRLLEGARTGDLNTSDPRKMGAMKKNGGKVIYWNGIPDYATLATSTIYHYDTYRQSDPDAASFVRLFLVPGTGHCGGGPGPQDVTDRVFEKLVAWVEEDRAPDSIVATSPVDRTEGMPSEMVAGIDGVAPAVRAMLIPQPSPTRTVLLCPYPQVAQFKGGESTFPYDASNWHCVAPSD